MKQYQDKYFKRAKKENYAARSVYKLKEMDQRFSLFKPGQTVLDLGAAPGSWTQYAGERVGKAGRVLGVDIQDTRHTFAENITFLQADVFSDSPELLAAMEPLAPFDLVISDMAPKTTGIKFADQANSLELCERAFEVAGKRLKRGGHFVVKIFEGAETKEYRDSLRPHFDKVKNFKPYSSRSESKEIFVIALGFKGVDG
ncbi:MAG: RlmE family RNA methyltransferase [Pseudodesulfovibrio sp.]